MKCMINIVIVSSATPWTKKCGRWKNMLVEEDDVVGEDDAGGGR